MRNFFAITAAAMLTMAGNAQTVTQQDDWYEETISEESKYMPLTPTYLDNVFDNGGWTANWFVTLRGGMNAFVGKPVGHGDLSDRTKAALQVSAGKWLTPRVALRIVYEGTKFKTSSLEENKYYNLHMDAMYNIASHFNKTNEQMPRWELAPYIGPGLISNSTQSYSTFGLNYGLAASYRVTERLKVTAEFGNTTTFQQFDGIGEENKLGDNMLHLMAGVTIGIGRQGWKKVVDPMPYMHQNDLLMNRVSELKEQNNSFRKRHAKDAMALREMRKILEIEGLLDKYELVQTDSDTKKKPRNDYSGLNRLRARLRNKDWNGNWDNYKPVQVADNDTVTDNADKYFHKMKDGKIYVGSPIFFFFQLGKDELTEKAQIINIREIASTIKKYGMTARVVGAADSQTGTSYINEKLSEKRAQYIAAQLIKEGVTEDQIVTQHQGGINDYEPVTGNRNTSVMLFFK